MKGYVYIISNPSMPGIYKIGYTDRDPQNRAQELYTTGVPTPFNVEYEILVENPYYLEQNVHNYLLKYNCGKEWFRCDLSVCIDAIHKCNSNKIYFEKSYNKNPLHYNISYITSNKEKTINENEALRRAFESNCSYSNSEYDKQCKKLERFYTKIWVIAFFLPMFIIPIGSNWIDIWLVFIIVFSIVLYIKYRFDLVRIKEDLWFKYVKTHKC